jgi:hypothetical protein
MKTMLLNLFLILALASISCSNSNNSPPPSCNSACVGADGSCMTCYQGYCSNSVVFPGCSSIINGVSCCPNVSVTYCNPGYCLSGNRCCAANTPYLCNGLCYASDICGASTLCF